MKFLVLVISLVVLLSTMFVSSRIVLANDAINPIQLTSTNWSVWYQIGNSEHDGVEIVSASYKSKSVIAWGSLQFIAVKYVNPSFVNFDHLCHTNGVWLPNPPTGYGSASCIPKSGNVVTQTSPFIQVQATFDDGVYDYVQTWQFHEDGRMENQMRYYGPGQCPGDNCSRYWVFWRMDYDVNTFGANTFYRCDSGSQSLKTTENEYPSDGLYCSNSEWRQKETATSTRFITIVPLARDDQDASNRPRITALLWQTTEWDAGDGGNSKLPQTYATNQSINGADIVLWYESRVPWKEACERGQTENCTTGFTTKAIGY